MSDTCEGGNQEIWYWFNDCLRDTVDYVSFSLGMLSIALYLVAMLPQFWKNYQRKTVEGLSVTFLLIWFFGDLFNFTGAVLTEQIASVQLTGAYFVLTEAATLSQYCYYKYFYKRKIASDEEFAEEESVWLLKGDEPENGSTSIKSEKTASNSVVGDYSLNSRAHVWILVVIAASLISRINASTESPAHGQESVIVGSVLAWTSGMLYLTSRIPQICTNYRLKTAAGLSPVLFIFTISANLSYAMAILLRFPPMDTKFFQSILPYLIGSVGTLTFDFTILYQTRLYRHPPRSVRAHSHMAEFK